MTNLSNLRRLVFISFFSLSFTPVVAIADDIDIFTGSSGGDAAAANVIFLLENTTDWSNNAQKIPLIAGGTGSQGQAELDAITNAVNSLTNTNSMDIGLSMFTDSGGPTSASGAYVRFGARDMSNATNKTAFTNILSGIYSSITSPSGKLQGQKSEDEGAALYELYKYFYGLNPYSGAYIAGANNNQFADINGNPNSATAFNQGLTSGFALSGSTSSVGHYNNPSTSCSKQYVIFIANNNSAATMNAGQSNYETGGPSVTSLDSDQTYSDEWASYLYQQGITVYVIDVYNKNSKAAYSTALQKIAKNGGGKYFLVNDEATLSTDLSQIFNEIQAVNSTFASTSLPVSTTNRAQEKNQVFIPMFRPDPGAYPRWMGNMKQYQLINVGGSIELGDSSSPSLQAINNNTGFPTDCAVSFWSTDSSTYWSNVTETPTPKGNCSVSTQWSDAPDGPFVEKGGAAEVIRKGNNPPTTNTTPTWAVNRTINTLSGTSLTAFNTTSSGLTSTVVNYTLGQDVNAEYNGRTAPSALTRPSLHGDTIHSRPLPIDYGSKVVVYYGANDGMYRAIDSSNGKELWAFVAPEHYSTLSRLSSNSPQVTYPNMPATTPASTPKDYFFDGSTGIYQNSDNSKIWIYPSMRRGGRMIYSFDVTTNSAPAFKWKVGCPNLTNDTGCTTSMSGIGQTWSTPQVAEHISGYANPVVIVGGGYDSGTVAAANASARNCEDTNNATPSGCSTTEKGAGVYVLDANTGALVQSFTTTRSVAADVALISVTTAGVVDHAYAVDTGGNIYRIDFKSSGTADWVINRVAYTNGSGRKFLFPPALLSVGINTVYLALGSGDREHPLYSQYPYSSVTNRFYVYADNLLATTAYNLDSTTNMNNNTTDAGCSSVSVLDSTKKGWFMDLNQYGQGEQTVTSSVIASGLVAFSTNRPIAPASGSCTTTLGEARGYWVNLFNGSGAVNVTGSCGGDRSATFVGGGLPPSPIFGVVPVNGVSTPVVIGAVQRNGGANSAIAPQKVTPITSPERKLIYWKSSGQN